MRTARDAPAKRRARPTSASRPFGQARQRRAAARPIAKPRRAGPGPTARRLAGAVALAAAIVWVGLPSLGPRPPERAACGRRVGRPRARRPAGRIRRRAIRRRSPSASARAWLCRRRWRRGLRLVGARLAPGSQATATLYLYENSRGERVALMVEPLDEIAPRRRGAAKPTASASPPGPAQATVSSPPPAKTRTSRRWSPRPARDDSLADAGAQRR